ncbi:hypothetical protein BH11PSE1_BH11PSE1_18940 [soil metagenome]
MLALGAGQTIAFAYSFYLLGVLGDDIAADLRLAPTFVFSLMSVALAASAVAALVIPRDLGGQMSANVGAPAPVVWDRRMIQLSVLFAGAWFISTCMSTHLPRLLMAFGLSATTAMSTAALVGVAAVAVRALEFAVLRRFPPLMATCAATLMHPLGATALLAFGKVAAPAMALGQGAGNGMLTVAKGVLPLSLWGTEGYAYRSAVLGRPALYGLALERSPTLALMGGAALCLVVFAMTFGLNKEPAT